MRDLVQFAHRLGHREVAGQEALLDHGQDQSRRAQLEVGGDLGEVGVTEDHVQAPVLLGVGVRLVAGIDDRALERGLEPDLDLEEVGALADLEPGRRAVLADTHPTGAGDDLAGDEERGELGDDIGERGRPAHEEVLVGSVGGALVVSVVLVQVDAVATGQ